MSQTTISAPSAASATACRRPWPRAPPVMRATRPSSFPIVVSVLAILAVLGPPANRRDAIDLGELGDDPVADGRRAVSVDEPADEGRATVYGIWSLSSAENARW